MNKYSSVCCENQLVPPERFLNKVVERSALFPYHFMSGRGRGRGTPQRPNGPLRRPNSLPLVLIIHRLKEHLYEAGAPRVPQVSLPF